MLGLWLAYVAGWTMEALLFGLTPSDSATLGAAALALGGVAALASYLPAARASRLDTTAALREQWRIPRPQFGGTRTRGGASIRR